MSSTFDQNDLNRPERAASARLDVADGLGEAAQLREAMDPANRSLAEALQLSFRVLQVAMIVLLGLFLFSGFKTVEANESGVATIWGRIVGTDELQPGLQMNWPPPVGEFMLVQAEGRVVDDEGAFKPRILGVQGEERAIRQSKATDRLKPEADGSVLTVGGEIGHVAAEARFEVVDSARFLEAVSDDAADALVRLALQRAIVQTAATHTLGELRNDVSTDALRAMLQEQTQSMLDKVNAGLRIVEVNVTDEVKPPLNLQKTFEEFSKVRQQVESNVESARQQAQERLITVAGEHHAELSAMIEEVEAAWADETARTEIIARIDELLDSGRISGEVYRTLSASRLYRTEIERTIGSEARRFASLQGEWNRHRDLVVAQRLLEVKGRLLGSNSAEMVFVPLGIGSLRLDISGLQHVRDTRRRTDIKRRGDATWSQQIGSAVDQYRRVDELKGDDAARQLKIDESGRLRGMREDY